MKSGTGDEFWLCKQKKTWLFRGFGGDDILPSCVGITRNHKIRIPELNNQDSMESTASFFHGSCGTRDDLGSR